MAAPVADADDAVRLFAERCEGLPAKSDETMIDYLARLTRGADTAVACRRSKRHENPQVVKTAISTMHPEVHALHHASLPTS